ncbi:MAG: hypothetical protein ACXVB9_06915 [Bdellovibrionota bacterium]
MRTIFFALVFAVLTPGHAFAIHSYNDEDCTATLKGKNVKVHMPDDDGWIQVRSELGVDPNEDGTVGYLLAPSDKGGDPAAEILMDSVKEAHRVSKKYNDGCWIGVTGTLDRTVKVRSLSPAAEKKLGFGAGQVLQLKCSFENIDPDGSQCEGK